MKIVEFRDSSGKGGGNNKPCNCDVAKMNRSAVTANVDQLPKRSTRTLPDGVKVTRNSYSGFIPSCPSCNRSNNVYPIKADGTVWMCILCHPGCEHDPSGADDMAILLSTADLKNMLSSDIDEAKIRKIIADIISQ